MSYQDVSIVARTQAKVVGPRGGEHNRARACRWRRFKARSFVLPPCQASRSRNLRRKALCDADVWQRVKEGVEEMLGQRFNVVAASPTDLRRRIDGVQRKMQRKGLTRRNG
jgi:hypothetical protein